MSLPSAEVGASRPRILRMPATASAAASVIVLMSFGFSTVDTAASSLIRHRRCTRSPRSMSAMSWRAASSMVSRVKPETSAETPGAGSVLAPLKCASTRARFAVPGLRIHPFAFARLFTAVWLIPCFAAMAVTGSMPARYAASTATQSMSFAFAMCETRGCSPPTAKEHPPCTGEETGLSPRRAAAGVLPHRRPGVTQLR